MPTIASLLIDLGMNVARLSRDVSEANRVVDRGVRDIQRQVGRLRGTFQSVVVGAGFGLIGRELLQAAKEGEQASTRLNAVLRATGHQAGLTKAELDDMAERMQAGIGFDDESLRNAQSTLLKFGNIHGDVFREAMKLSADLAAFMGTNVPEAAQMLGKSLQSPTEGLTMMERQFGKLSPAQKKHIEDLVAQGRAIEAQNAVLDIWRQKIGGVAAEMNTGLTKASRDVANAWNDMLEKFGRTPTSAGLAERALQGLKAVMDDIANIGQDTSEKLAPDALQAQVRLDRLMGGPEGSGRRRTVESLRPSERAIYERDMALLRRYREMTKRPEPEFVSGMDHPSTASVMAGMLGAPEDWRKVNKDWLADQEKLSRELEEGAETRAEAQALAAQSLVDAQQKAFERARKLRALDLQETEDFSDHEVDVLHAQYEERNRILIETYDLEQDLAIETGQAVLDAEEEKRRAIRASADAAREFGLVMTSALEDAVIDTKDLSTVVQAFNKDLARMIMRINVTQPMAKAVSDFNWADLFGNAGVADSGMDFGGGRAGGGPVMAGRTYLVGEEGPEVLTMGPTNGHITPNGALGGGDVYLTQNIHIDSRSDQATILAAMNAAKEQAKVEIRRAIKNGSTAYSSD